ncbi:MAG: glycosyltransferase, partial [Candidatus Sericytochromatia bacterium]
MRVALLTAGSRGDVQPYTALALGLQRAGHEVTVVTHGPFEPLVTGYGLPFKAIAGDPRAILSGEVGRSLVDTGDDFLGYMRHMIDTARPLWRQYLKDLEAGCRGAEAIVFSPLAFPAFELADALEVPAFLAPIVPLAASREAPMYLAPGLPLGPIYNGLTHDLFRGAASQVLRLAVDAWRRRDLGLPPLGLEGPLSRARQAQTPMLHGFSETVIPRPADWPAHHVVTGSWCFDAPAGYEPPPALLDFLEAGPKPIYVGFGSMIPQRPKAVTAAVLEAIARAGCRAVLATGWGGLAPEDVPAHVHVLEGAPHDWLFPRMAAVVHHGGAGTTAAALRAGVPSIVVPFFSDQPYWAARVAELGVGPAPLPARALTAATLAEAIERAVADPGMSDRARAVGDRLAAEDGVGRAVAAFHA